jgi:hypothetical protein
LGFIWQQPAKSVNTLETLSAAAPFHCKRGLMRLTTDFKKWRKGGNKLSTSSEAPTNPIKSALKHQLVTRQKFPEGHVIARAYAYLFGPHNHTQPNGHPLLIGTPPFDASVTTPLAAMMQEAAKRIGIMPHADSWELELEEDVIQPIHGNAIPYHKVFHFKFLPEQHKHVGLNVPIVFKDCHYLTKQHLSREVDPASAHRLHSVQVKVAE